MSQAQCTKGWDGRCSTATSRECECACGGDNHGKDAGRKQLPIPFKPNSVIFGDHETREVYIGGRNLSPRRSQKAYNHSPDGFAWGYGGSAPAQLALALLLEYTGKERALALYQQFKFDVIASFNKDQDLILPASRLKAWLDDHKKL